MKIIYKIIYNAGVNRLLRPFAKLVFNLSKKKIITISGRLTLNFFGTNFVLKTNQTCSVTQDLFFYGPENYEFSPLFRDVIKKSSVFFDVGANIGFFTILAEKMNPDCKIFTFEPSQGPHHYVSENIRLNQLKNVTLIKKAVSDIDGQLEFHDVINSKYPWVKYNLNGSNSLQNNFGLEKASSYIVDVITLDEVMRHYKLKSVDLIKLDTECTEHLILQSCKQLIQQFEPMIICEVYDVIAKEVQAVLDDLNRFELYQYRDHYIEKIDSLQDVSADTKYRNFVFCPNSKKHLIQHFIR